MVRQAVRPSCRAADSGKLDVYQWLYFLAQHARRHIAQMEENEREAGA